MRHGKSYRKLSRQRSHYRATMRNLALALFEHERIETTVTKAKEVRSFVDRIITLGKKGSLHDRRRAAALMGNKIIRRKNGDKLDIVGKVFTELSERYKTRAGGYTRIYKLARERAGDAAPMAIFELVDANLKAGKKEPATDEKTADSNKPKKSATKKKATKKAAKPKKATATKEAADSDDK